MEENLRNFLKYIAFCYFAIKHISYRNIRFQLRRLSNERKTDDELLLTRICYEGHHLEKVTKNTFSQSRGRKRAQLLKKLLEEFKERGLNNDEIIKWADNILEKYNTWRRKKEIVINRCEDFSNHRRTDSIIDAITTRSSVRFWRPKLIEEDVIEKIIEAGINGPMSCNRQALKVCIEKNKAENVVFGESNNPSMFSKAPLILYVAKDERFYKEKYASALDAGSFCANALLAAYGLGLGGCWVYQCEFADQKKLRTEFNLERYYYVYSALLIGYPAEIPEKPLRKRTDTIIIKPKIKTVADNGPCS